MNKIKNALKNFFKMRSFKYGTNSAILIVAVIVIAILLNLGVGQLSDRFSLKADLTANKIYSLTDTSKNILKDLKQDVTIIGLFDDGKASANSTYKEVTGLLGQYEKYDRVKVQYIDPDKNPGIIKELDPQDTMGLESGYFVVKSTVNGKEKKKALSIYDLFATTTDETTYSTTVTGSNAEQGLTGAVKYVTAEKTPVIYFTEGHDETVLDSSYTTMKAYLDKNNYEVQTINLTTAGKVPEDAEIIVFASPKNDLSSTEADALSAYLKAGGKALFMFDYLSNDPDLENFNTILGSYNVAVNYDKVKEEDANRHPSDDQYTILMDVNSSDVISDTFNTIMSGSRSISILKNTKEYVTTTSIMQTGDQAIGEPASASRSGNTKGPLDIAVAVENEGGSAASKIVVMGNASFISDDSSSAYGNYFQNNMYFFLKSINWMYEATDDVVVPTKDYDAQQINVSELQASVMGGVVTIVLPLLILGAGLFVFLRRRHL